MSSKAAAKYRLGGGGKKNRKYEKGEKDYPPEAP